MGVVGCKRIRMDDDRENGAHIYAIATILIEKLKHVPSNSWFDYATFELITEFTVSDGGSGSDVVGTLTYQPRRHRYRLAVGDHVIYATERDYTYHEPSTRLPRLWLTSRAEGGDVWHLLNRFFRDHCDL